MFDTTRLHYVDGLVTGPIPEWGRFYLELGAKLADEVCEGTLWRVALAVPTRSFCASLVATGFVAARVMASSSTEDAHLHALRGLQIGHEVSLARNGRRLKGKWRGFRQDCLTGEEFGVRVHSRASDGKSYWYPVARADRVRIMDADSVALPKSTRGKSVPSESVFARALLERDEVTTGRVCTVVLGRITLLHHELVDSTFCLAENATCRGSLNDIVRARRFVPQGERATSDVFAVRRPKARTPGRAGESTLAILDGCSTLVRLRDVWRQKSWVAVLDRTDRRFWEAVETVNAECVRRRSDHKLELSSRLPHGVELVTWQVGAH